MSIHWAAGILTTGMRDVLKTIEAKPNQTWTLTCNPSPHPIFLLPPPPTYAQATDFLPDTPSREL